MRRALHDLIRTAALGAAVALGALAMPAPAPAQERAPTPSGIVTLSQERLVSQTLYGQRIAAEVEAATAQLSAENRRIETQLAAEELDLTERRDGMDPAEFRLLADDFDTRVEAIRAAQEAKGRDLQAAAEAAQTRFFELAFPILLDIVRARGAAVMMDSRAVLISAEGIDITEVAIAQIDAVLGDGGPEPLIAVPGLDVTPDPAPDPAPDPTAPGD